MSADFWAGYISGATGIIVGNPLDLIKTRLQAGGTQAIQPASAASLRSTFDQAGTLVRGATAPVLGYGALNALLFVTYNRSLEFLSSYSPNTSPTYSQIYLSGVLGGLATFVVSAPTELIKVRTQVAGSSVGRSSGLSPTSSSFGIAAEIWRRAGVKGFYHGGGVTVVRDAVGYGFYFCSYDLSKRLMSTYLPGSSDAETLSAWKILLCGGIAGCISWASIFPLDVIKTRIQSQSLTSTPAPSPIPTPPRSPSQQPLLSPKPSPQPSSSSSSSTTSAAPSILRQVTSYQKRTTLTITREVYREGGLSIFFRGLGICSVRAFVVNAVQWAVYEWAMTALSQKKSVDGVRI